MEKRRRRQFVYVSRYAHVPPSEFMDESIEDFQAFHDELSNLVGEENQTKKPKD